MSLPLDGITVVSIEQAVSAPFATRQLADLGARVIKIERPDGGDFARHYDLTVGGLSSYQVDGKSYAVPYRQDSWVLYYNKDLFDKAKVGYPDVWPDPIASLDRSTPYIQWWLAVSQARRKKNLDSLGAAVDRKTWREAPIVVNAFYDGSYNEIVFPAAVLQSPEVVVGRAVSARLIHYR